MVECTTEAGDVISSNLMPGNRYVGMGDKFHLGWKGESRTSSSLVTYIL